MTIGSTPTHTFSTPIRAFEIAEAEIAYQQGETLINKHTSDLTISDYKISTVLTQAETYMFFNGSRKVRVQVRIKTTSGAVLISDIKNIEVLPTLFKEEI